jgi:hypothetical protein
MSFYSDQAQHFLNMAQDIQDRLDNESLDTATYDSLEKQRDGLQDQANAMITTDVQAALAQLKIDKVRLAKGTADLEAAEKKAQKIEHLMAIVSAGLTLATAIASANPESILSALQGAEKAVADQPSGNGLAMAASGDDSGS